MSDQAKLKRIQQQLDEKHGKFLKQAYDAKVPDGLIQSFINAIMTIPPQGHKVMLEVIEGVTSKTEEELTFEEVGIVIKVLLNTSWDKLYADLHEAIEKHRDIENFIIVYNEKIAKHENALRAERETLMKLAGVGLSNGRIITNN